MFWKCLLSDKQVLRYLNKNCSRNGQDSPHPYFVVCVSEPDLSECLKDTFIDNFCPECETHISSYEPLTCHPSYNKTAEYMKVIKSLWTINWGCIKFAYGCK